MLTSYFIEVCVNTMPHTVVKIQLHSVPDVKSCTFGGVSICLISYKDFLGKKYEFRKLKTRDVGYEHYYAFVFFFKFLSTEFFTATNIPRRAFTGPVVLKCPFHSPE